MIEDLEQLRLLSDPMKLSLAQVFGEAEGTVAAAAERLGQPQTRLYRHVDALLAAGLLEVTREQPKRGTVERGFRTVARRFEVAEGLLPGDAESDGGETETLRTLLRGAESEILEALRVQDADAPPTVARFRAKLTPAQLEELQQKMFAWLEEAQASAPDAQAEDGDGDATLEIGALIALYRLPGT